MPTSSSCKLVALAIDKDRGSQVALQWTVDKLIERGQTLLLLHVKLLRPPDGSVPNTPGNESENRDSDLSIRELFLPFRIYCTRYNIKCKDVVLEGRDVAEAVVEYVNRSAIEILVLGASEKTGFIKRFTQKDIPGSVLKGAPDFCAVYVISKGGYISSHRSASRPAAPSRSNVSDTSLSSTSSSIGNTRTFADSSMHRRHIDSNSNKVNIRGKDVAQDSQFASTSKKRNRPCTTPIDSNIELKRPPTSAYSCFMGERIYKYQSDNPGQKLTKFLISHFDEEWKELPENEKLVYANKSSEEYNVVGLRDELIELKNETRDVKNQVIEVKNEMTKVKKEVMDINTSVNGLTLLIRQLMERLELPTRTNTKKKQHDRDEDEGWGYLDTECEDVDNTSKDVETEDENNVNSEDILEEDEDYVVPHKVEKIGR